MTFSALSLVQKYVSLQLDVACYLTFYGMWSQYLCNKFNLALKNIAKLLHEFLEPYSSICSSLNIFSVGYLFTSKSIANAMELKLNRLWNNTFRWSDPGNEISAWKPRDGCKGCFVIGHTAITSTTEEPPTRQAVLAKWVTEQKNAFYGGAIWHQLWTSSNGNLSRFLRKCFQKIDHAWFGVLLDERCCNYYGTVVSLYNSFVERTGWCYALSKQ